MYVKDRKHRQKVVSYIKFVYGVDLEINRLYIFRNEYNGTVNDYYSISKYPGYHTEYFPPNIPAVEVDRYGDLLLRKDKIEKIRNNGNNKRCR